MPPKKRTRTVSAPPATQTPEKTAAAAVETPKHAGSESKKQRKAPAEEASTPLPRSSPSASQGPKAGKSSERKSSADSLPRSKSASVHLSEEKKSARLSTSMSPTSLSNAVGAKKQHSPMRPLKLNLADDLVEVGQEPQVAAAAAETSAGFSPTNTVKDLASVVLRSKVIAPDVSGISCIAVNRSESEVVVARENGSLVLYRVEYFQNIPHFTQIRTTGGRVRRSITRVAFIDIAPLTDAAQGATTTMATDTAAAAAVADMRDRYFVASYLSGQMVIYDSETLFPVSVYQRTGGAVWDFTVLHGSVLYAALADGSWHRLRVVLSRPAGQQQPRLALQLERIIPRVAGADRAFSVAGSAALGVVVGTDDAGNVHAWRHAGSGEGSDGVAPRSEGGDTLSSHETLWTCRLPKGMAMCCAIADGAAATGVVRPVVAVGTSMGDVVFIDALHGRILHTFTTHKGPVSTIVCSQNVFYASGWHESLRAFRCATTGGQGSAESASAAAEGEWYPAEVKRRTHYHEASELLVLPQRQLMLSAARDGTLLYAPLAQLFSAPAMYVTVTTQRFAFAQQKNVLLQTRLDRIEAFRTDAAVRHWSPAFAHNIHGKFHLNGLWCDARLHYVVFSTDERVVVSRIVWRDGAEAALAIQRIEEVLELPAGRGLVDALFVPRGASGTAPAGREHADGASDEEAGAPTEPTNASFDEGALYLLFDDYVLYVTLVDGFPVIRTALTNHSDNGGDATPLSAIASGSGIRPVKLVHCPPSSKEVNGKPSPASSASLADGSGGSLVAYGLRGLWRCELSADGTPNPDTSRLAFGPTVTFTHVAAIPRLMSGSNAAAGSSLYEVVGLCAADDRYVKGITSAAASSSAAAGGGAMPRGFPASLPHDVTFIAELPRATKKAEGDAAAGEEAKNFVGYFSKGLVFVGRREWRMACRMNVEAAFVMADNCHILVLERNLEKTLEALPLCWKVRRFGN